MKTLGLVKIIFILLLSFSKTLVYSQSLDLSEKVKIVINLSKFINWNNIAENTAGKQILLIVSNDYSTINYEIQSKKEFKYKSWQIICRDNLDDVNEGMVVFITSEKKSLAKRAILLSDKVNIITVSDNIDKFCYSGGMINIKRDDKINSFEINYRKIQDKNIKVSSKLLALAKIY